jgi:hypothetical protein
VIYYITFNDQPSGVYQSQVVDVVKTLSQLSKKKVILIAFFPLNGFSKNRAIIKSSGIESIVIPMVFGITKWRWYKFVLKAITNNKFAAICRGPLATVLALGNFKKVVHDGRAAVKAEIEEYNITGGNEQLNKDFCEAEQQAVMKSDFNIAVSHQLVKYWQQEFNYHAKNHVVIPCTLTNSTNENLNLVEKQQKNTVKIVYAGGTSGWQSFEKVVDLLRDLLQRQSNVNVLFLIQEHEAVDGLISSFPDRCERMFVAHEQVHSILQSCDYGILIRDKKVTNRVASPVKFAEYLSAGLSVLISEGVGDFSEFVTKHQCGIIIHDAIPELQPLSEEEKRHNRTLCHQHFSKDSEEIIKAYQKVLIVA